MTFDVKVYPQFQPSSASDVRDVVLANRNTPVRTKSKALSLAYQVLTEILWYILVEIASVPFRPK
jgi:hypothetical protein